MPTYSKDSVKVSCFARASSKWWGLGDVKFLWVQLDRGHALSLDQTGKWRGEG